MSLSLEIEAQRERVEELEWSAQREAQGYNQQGSHRGIRKKRFQPPPPALTKPTIKRYKQELAKLEVMLEKSQSVQIQPRAQALIDSGEVTQWKKRQN